MKRVITLLFALTLITGFASNTSYAQTGFNAVLEYCTGTWCQYCPCGETIIDGIKINYPNTVILGYHGPTGSDPWGTYSSAAISYFGFNAYPTGIINRKDSIVDRGAWNNKVVISSNVFQPGVSFQINNYNYNSSTHNITGNVVSTASQTMTGNFYIVMVLTEDNLVYSQTGNTGCPGSSTWVHKYVVKGLVTTPQGTLLNTSLDTWTQGTSVTTPLNYTFPAGVIDANCKLNIFVYQYGYSQFSSVVQQSKFFDATTGPTGIQNQNQVAEQFSLSQNYPNPFNPTTNIHFSIPKDGNVSLKIYDMLGKEVETYSDGFMKAGTYNAEVDASSWASGIYFYTLKSDNFVETKKMTLIK